MGVVKNLDSAYTSDVRALAWMKLKKDYLEASLCDTIDAVVVGAWYGNGKNAGLFSSFLLAVQSSSGDGLQTLTRVGSGFKRSQLLHFFDKFQCLSSGKDIPPDI